VSSSAPAPAPAATVPLEQQQQPQVNLTMNAVIPTTTYLQQPSGSAQQPQQLASGRVHPPPQEILPSQQQQTTWMQQQQQQQQQQQPPEPQQTSTFDDDEDSMSYPKIGPGYSDSISVVSDLTTPTVVTQMTVPDEEHYSDGHHHHGGAPHHRNYIQDHLAHNQQHHRHHTQELPREPSISTLEPPGSRNRDDYNNHVRSRTVSPAPPSAQTSPPRGQDGGVLTPSTTQSNKGPQKPGVRGIPGQRNYSSGGSGGSGGGAAARRQQQHAAVFGKLAAGHHPSQQYKQTKHLQHTSMNKMAIPENTVSENTDYPSPTYFPSVFPQDDLSGSVPRSTKSGSRRSLLGHNSSSKRTMSSSQTKNTKRLGMRGIRRARSASNAATSSSSNAYPQQPYGTIQQQPPPPPQPQKQSRSSKLQSSKRQSSPAILPSKTAAPGKGKSSKTDTSNGNVDIDNVLSSMGQDIDYVFRELSALEDGGGDPQQQQQRPSPQEHLVDDIDDELSAVSESNLGKTAKIKYTLGSVARSLRTNDRNGTSPKSNGGEGGKKLLSSSKQEKANWGSLDSSSNHRGSSVKSGESDPLLIDSDGFIIGQGDESDPFANAFSSSGGSGHNNNNNNNAGPASRSKGESSSSFGSQDIFPAGAAAAAPKQPIPAVNNTKDAFDSFWNKNKEAKQPQPEEAGQASMRNVGQQQQQPVAIRPPSKRTSSQRRSASMEKPKPESASRLSPVTGSGAIKPIPASKKETSPRRSASLEERRRAAATVATASGTGVGEQKKESRIDALEMETKQRIELLRKLVAERQQMPDPQQQQQQHRQSPSMMTGGNAHGGGEDAALSNKLDFVEEETMKQIARLRQQQQQQHREGGLEI